MMGTGMQRPVIAVLSSCLLAAAGLAGCQATPDPSPTAVPPRSAAGSASAPVTSPRSASAAITSPEPQWGPLAVIPPLDGSDLVLAKGTLRITDMCVYLVSNGKRTFLFWSADRTTWSPQARAIRFSNLDGTVVSASDGDAVSVAGGGDSEAESGMSWQVWASRMVWVAPPHPSCSTQERFGVGSLNR